MFTACVYPSVPAACSGSRAHPLRCWQQHLLGERVMALTPCVEPKDSNYPLQTALTFALWLMLQLTPKHQKAGPGSPHLMVQCCKSSLAHILSLSILWYNGAVLKFRLANTRFSKIPSLASVREGDRKGVQGCLTWSFFGPEGKLFELFTWLCWTFPGHLDLRERWKESAFCWRMPSALRL